MNDHAETAILAGGCFWGVQELLRKRDGVISTRVGYAGGENDNPTDEDPGGHAEAVEVVFDPERASYRDILEFFFQIHDPTTKDRQGEETGSYVRSESSTRATSSAKLPRTRSPTSTPQACGPAR